MKIKIVGFKVGVDRATFYKKIEIDDVAYRQDKNLGVSAEVGMILLSALDRSDFVSVRK